MFQIIVLTLCLAFGANSLVVRDFPVNTKSSIQSEPQPDCFQPMNQECFDCFQENYHSQANNMDKSICQKIADWKYCFNDRNYFSDINERKQCNNAVNTCRHLNSCINMDIIKILVLGYTSMAIVFFWIHFNENDDTKSLEEECENETVDLPE